MPGKNTSPAAPATDPEPDLSFDIGDPTPSLILKAPFPQAILDAVAKSYKEKVNLPVTAKTEEATVKLAAQFRKAGKEFTPPLTVRVVATGPRSFRFRATDKVRRNSTAK